MYGRDACLPTAMDITAPTERKLTNFGVFNDESLKQESWPKRIHKSRNRTMTRIRVGEIAFLYKPAAKSGIAFKFARPYYGPYQIVEITTNDAKICPIDKPSEEPIFVALDQLRHCPEEIGDEFWPTRPKHTPRIQSS